MTARLAFSTFLLFSIYVSQFQYYSALAIKPILGDWGRFIKKQGLVTLKFFTISFLLGLLFVILLPAIEICSQTVFVSMENSD